MKRTYRIGWIYGLVLAGVMGTQALAQQQSADQIYRQLKNGAPAKEESEAYSIKDIKRSAKIRGRIPAVHVNTINFSFNSTVVPRSERWKLRNLARALKRFSRRNRGEKFLLEGHTDAVGRDAYNMTLSRGRARAIRKVLVRSYAVPRYTLETVGYGERHLLVPTRAREWRNRRVTVRRITGWIRGGPVPYAVKKDGVPETPFD